MTKDKKPNVSKHILDKAAFIFIRHPEQIYSRSDIQNILGISKTTACRVIVELSRILNLKEEKDGQIIYYSLTNNDAKNIYQTLDFILAVSDKERLALNFLLHSQEAQLFNDSIVSLREKLNKVGIISYHNNSIFELCKTTQSIAADNEYILETLFISLETKTKVEIKYQSAFSDRMKIHELYPVGLYLRDGNLYLYAYSPRFKDATSFAYSRMKGITLIEDEHYTIPSDISIDDIKDDPFGIAITKPKKVKVHIYNKQADFEKEKEWTKGTIITENEDHSITMELTITDPFAFRCWALSLGKDCFVEEPSDLAEWVYREHKEACKFYESSHNQ